MKCPACYGDGSVPAHSASGGAACRTCKGTGKAPWSALIDAAGEALGYIDPDESYAAISLRRKLEAAINLAKGE